MARGRKLMTMLLAATFAFIGSRTSSAQDKTPPPRMLLNLDLFTPQPGDAGGPNAGDSMFHQLRTLRSMGYLTADGPLPDANDNSPQPPPEPASQKDQEQVE